MALAKSRKWINLPLVSAYFHLSSVYGTRFKLDPQYVNGRASNRREDTGLDDYLPFYVLLVPQGLMTFKDKEYSDYLYDIKDCVVQYSDCINLVIKWSSSNNQVTTTSIGPTSFNGIGKFEVDKGQLIARSMNLMDRKGKVVLRDVIAAPRLVRTNVKGTVPNLVKKVSQRCNQVCKYRVLDLGRSP
ncbi:hypothetical protein PIB30_065817 [Stylosanthes scabra]|uniref:Uncharacterized protein n=1 Tax=Stylosanthes scabra TaxID=79078 RepID=A0ABU6WLS1_9FABA|nr:hypothetical protein [Stylosanthes scabra]